MPIKLYHIFVLHCCFWTILSWRTFNWPMKNQVKADFEVNIDTENDSTECMGCLWGQHWPVNMRAQHIVKGQLGGPGPSFANILCWNMRAQDAKACMEANIAMRTWERKIQGKAYLEANIAMWTREHNIPLKAYFVANIDLLTWEHKMQGKAYLEANIAMWTWGHSTLRPTLRPALTC